MDFDFWEIAVTVLFSAVGFVYFSYGKKQSEFKLMACGALLMGYSYLMPSLFWNIVVGAVLAAVPFLWR